MQSLQGRLDRCSINTATLGHREPLSTIIERIARAGFGGIAPWRSEVEGHDVVTLGRQIRSAGLVVSGYCRSTYLPALCNTDFQANVEANKKALRDAAELQARCFVMVVGGVPVGSKDLHGAREQVFEGTAQLLETAREVGVPLALEPLHPAYAANRSVLNTIDQALQLCQRVDAAQSGFLGIAVDIYHCWWDPNFNAATLAAGADKRIMAYHVSDWLHETQDVLLDRGMMGDGIVDLQGMRQVVEAAGYRDLVEVEIFSKANWWQREPDEVLARCAERLQSVC
jgi:sugar phosphate isomerase/epimerase